MAKRKRDPWVLSFIFIWVPEHDPRRKKNSPHHHFPPIHIYLHLSWTHASKNNSIAMQMKLVIVILVTFQRREDLRAWVYLLVLSRCQLYERVIATTQGHDPNNSVLSPNTQTCVEIIITWFLFETFVGKEPQTKSIHTTARSWRLLVIEILSLHPSQQKKHVTWFLYKW